MVFKPYFIALQHDSNKNLSINTAVDWADISLSAAVFELERGKRSAER
jgi:hypothetical protein